MRMNVQINLHNHLVRRRIRGVNKTLDQRQKSGFKVCMLLNVFLIKIIREPSTNIQESSSTTFRSTIPVNQRKRPSNKAMALMFIRDIQSFQYVPRLRVRVARIWRPKRYNTDMYDGLHYMIIDEMGDVIHAIIEEPHYAIINNKMQQGRVYDILHCYSREDDSPFKVADHEAQLFFNKKTVFTPVEEPIPRIPQHFFYLLEFSELADKKENQKLLIDVYGCVKSIMPEAQVFVRSKEKLESKCEVILENLRREDVRITFWGDNAREFDVEIVQKHPPPVLAVFTSLRITEFQERTTLTATNHTCLVIDPQIPQRDEYRKEFSKPGDKVKILAIPFKQPTQQDLKSQRKKTVPDLNTLNPRLYTNDTVYCCGKISRFSTHNSWWYNGCPLCHKQLRQKENSSQLSCKKHDVQEPLPCYRVYMTIEDRENEATLIVMEKAAEQLFGNSCQELMNRRQYPTRQTLPKEIEDTIGQHHLFQIEPRSNRELIVKAIFPDRETSVGVTEQDPTTATPDRSTSEKKENSRNKQKSTLHW